jgi:hypothetical protein
MNPVELTHIRVTVPPTLSHERPASFVIEGLWGRLLGGSGGQWVIAEISGIGSSSSLVDTCLLVAAACFLVDHDVHRTDDFFGDIFLDCERIAQRAVIGLRPQL